MSGAAGPAPPAGAPQVKICGVTTAADAAAVAALGVELIGLNFWPRSRRYLAPARAAEVAGAARQAGPARLVGVFVDPSEDDLARVAALLDVVQLHGDEPPAAVAAVAARFRIPAWKALAVRGAADLDGLAGWPADALLLDAPTPGRGGGGEPFDWALGAEAVRRHPARRIVLAGGLTPGNVAAAIAQVRPWAVDVASGVEAAPGVKDLGKVAAFVAAARASVLTRR